MSRWMFVCLAFGLWACEDHAAPAVATPPPDAVTVESAETDAVPDDSPALRGGVYKQAYEQAKKDITLDNAHERLSALEREINLDWQKEIRE